MYNDNATLSRTNQKAVIHNITNHHTDGVSTEYKVLRRDKTISAFEPVKIKVAITKAFLAVEGEGSENSNRIHQIAENLTTKIVSSLIKHAQPAQAFHIENIQDQVELFLMREGHYKVAKAYVLYRQEQAKKRALNAPESQADDAEESFAMKRRDGTIQQIYYYDADAIIAKACEGLSDVSSELVGATFRKNIYNGLSEEELAQAFILAARVFIEKEPNYSYVCARLLLNNIYQTTLSYLAGNPLSVSLNNIHQPYKDYFAVYLKKGVEYGLLNDELLRFDLDKLAAAIEPERDMQFQYLGLQTLYDRYFLHIEENRIELPQSFFMRVAMGLALNETDREEKAIAFYRLLSSFDFMSSTPTLFNSGTTRSQLSSCYLTTVADDLSMIYKSFQDNAMLAKYSGGLGNDWTRVRGLGARIKGTNGKSQGVIPFLKVANDTAVAVNQGGKRKGAVCAYLETWHIDIESFLDLRKNTGDERRRTHDMNTANWIPDLFMQRVIRNQKWSLFSPDEVSDLHDLTGEAFKQRFEFYEQQAELGQIRRYKQVNAVDLWRKMLTMLFETGHPWLTFKDPCNIRSPQSHAGVVHSSNLCTEITLNTSDNETAVCNLGSVNLSNHIKDNQIDVVRLEATIRTAMRMLDNVIDINFYNTKESRTSNLRHRPVGLGLMGFQDALFKLKIPYASEAALDFADASMELISYFAIDASSELAKERGRYSSYDGSLWSQGILPVDSMQLLAQQRSALDAFDKDSAEKYAEMAGQQRLDWQALRDKVLRQGMRNSNTMAIAPTATISNICGVSQSIEPLYQNLYVKSNLSGEFVNVNRALVHDLKALGLWDEVMISDLKYYDGSLEMIERIPDDIKQLYATAFEIDGAWLVEAAARRQKWIDQAQSLNIYIARPSGKKLDEIYKLAWLRGLKTTYYLRAQAASHVEKSTTTDMRSKLNAVKTSQNDFNPAPSVSAAAKVCMLDDDECEACQ